MLGLPIVHVDEALTNVSVAYPQQDFMIEEVFAPCPVAKQADLYFKFTKDHFRADDDTYRPGHVPNVIEIDLEPRGSYQTDGHKLESVIPDQLRDNADPGADIDIEYTEKTTMKILLRQEINGVAQLNTTTIPQNVTYPAGGPKWSDYENSNPILDIDQRRETILQSTGALANRLVLPLPVFRTLRNHPIVKDAVKYTGQGLHTPLSVEEVAEAFQVDEVVVPKALQQLQTGTPPNEVGGRGEPDNLSFVWGNIALLYYTPGRPSPRTPAFAYSFIWKGGPGGASGLIVKRFRDERKESDVIHVQKWYALVLIEPNAGFLWNTPI